jgi:DNA-binding NarL/FixJ family response regulator
MPPRRLQVYLVEDSPILRRLFIASIVEAGVAVVGWSADAQKAIAELSELQPDVIVIDISLASGSGFDVLRALRELDWANDAMKILLTNHASEEYRELGAQLGADRFYDKSLETARAIRLIAGMASACSRSGGSGRRTSPAAAHS